MIVADYLVFHRNKRNCLDKGFMTDFLSLFVCVSVAVSVIMCTIIIMPKQHNLA